MTSPERFKQIEELFHLVADLPPDQRRKQLDQACGDDDDLRREVERLLARESRGAALAEPDPARPGDRIGPYELVRRIGEGGMGVVYEATQQEPVRRRVALKLIKWGMDTRQVIARFEIERQALARMSHPGIARVVDAGETDTGRPYFAMEFIDGQRITDYCQARSLDLRGRLELFSQVCTAVQHAHQKRVIHRDLKPGNVLVEEEDGRAQPKIIDFGIAKAIEKPLIERSIRTELGQLIGTPEYMSPEQAAPGSAGVDTRTDVYALGALLYELLTGVSPFDAEKLRQAGLEEIFRRIREDDPPLPSARHSTLEGRQLRGDLDWIAMKALEKNPARRYSSASELATDIERHLQHEPVMAGPPTAGYRLRKFVRRHRVGVIAGAAVALALTLGAGLATVGFVRAVHAEAQSREDAARAGRISEFLIELFRVTDPGESRGNTITAREILDRGSEKIREELAGEPRTQAGMMFTIGEVYRNLGLLEAAEPLLEQALQSRRAGSDTPDRDLLDALNGLGALRRAQGRFDEAESLYVEAIEGARKVFGATDAATLRHLDGLAALRVDQGRYDDAAKRHREILEIQRRELGPDHEDTLQTQINLATAYRRLGRSDEAEALIREALETYRRTLGVDHPRSIVALNNLAIVHWQRQQFEKARPLFEQSLELSRRVRGKDHPFTLSVMGNLATLYRQLELFEEAEALHQETLGLKRSKLGDDHPDTLDTMNNLGVFLFRQKRFDEAEKIYLDVLERRNRVLGAEHPRTISTVTNLALLFKGQGRYDESERMFAQGLEALRNRLGEDHSETIKTMSNLGSLYIEMERHSDAEKIYEGILTTAPDSLGADHFVVGVSHLNLALVRSDLGQHEAALSAARQAEAVLAARLGDKHGHVLLCLETQLAMLLELKRDGEAEALQARIEALR